MNSPDRILGAVVPHPLLRAAQADPDHLALYDDQGSLSYNALREAVVARGEIYHGWGLCGGDRVGFAPQRSLDSVVELVALGWHGLTACLYAPDTTTEAMASACTDANCVGWIDDDGFHRLSESTSGKDTGGETLGCDLGQALVVLQTSGTTGTPKLVVLTWGQILFGVMGSTMRLGHHLDDRWLNVLPLHHIGGLAIVYRCLWLGTTHRLIEHFDAEAISKTLDDEPITQMSLVPTMLERLLQHHSSEFPTRLRWALVGGAPLSEGLLAQATEHGLCVLPTWGMTETAAQIATPKPGRVRDQSSAPLLPFAFARNVSLDPSSVRPTNKRNEGDRLVVEGPQVGGALTTSDLGNVDDGWVTVRGRADRIVISGGENVSLDKVEHVASDHPLVARAAAFSARHAIWGQCVVLLVEGSDGTTQDDAALTSWLDRHLGPAERPKVVLIDGPKRRGHTLKPSAAQRDAWLAVAQSELTHALDEINLDRGSLVGFDIEEGVYVLEGGEQVAVAFYPELDGQSLFRRLKAEGRDRESVVESGGAPIVAFYVHQRKSPALREHFLKPIFAEDQGQ